MTALSVNGVSPATSVHPDIEPLRLQIAEFSPALCAFARRFVRHEHDVDDLVQETIFKALRSAHRFTPGTSLRSWLFTILRNTFCSRYKVKKREFIGLPVHLAQQLTTPADQLWRLEYEETIRAIDHLDPGQKQALLLIADGTSYADAAEICGCQIGTIKSRVNRARQSLRDGLH